MVSVTDAHVHVVSSDVRRFPLQPAAFGRDWWTGRPVDAETITQVLEAARVERAVVVQAVGPYGNDNRYAHEVANRDPGRYAFVGAIDTDGDDPAAELDRLVERGGVAGVRVAALSGEAKWLIDGRGEAIWAAAAACGTNLVVACLSGHLAAVGCLAQSFESVPVTLDHCGFPDLTAGPPFPNAAPLLDLAALPAIHLKLTTIVLQAVMSRGDAAAFVDLAVASFGADRVCWGSDHPQSYEVQYPEMVALAIDATAGLAADARACVLNTTARRLWFGSR